MNDVISVSFICRHKFWLWVCFLHFCSIYLSVMWHFLFIFAHTFDPFWYYVMPHRIIHSVNHSMAYMKTKEVKCNANITKRYDDLRWKIIWWHQFILSEHKMHFWFGCRTIFSLFLYIRIPNDLYDWHVFSRRKTHSQCTKLTNDNDNAATTIITRRSRKKI